MKHLNLISIICLILISCTHNKESETNIQDFFKSGTITITGQVNNLKTDVSNTIFLKQYNILSGKSEVTSFEIDTSGKFEKIVPVFNPQDISLDFQGRAIELLVKQSDSLNLVIDAQNQSKDVIISGIGGVRNTLFNQYLQLSFRTRRDYYHKTSGKKLDLILDNYNKTEAKLDSIIKSIPDIKQDNLLAAWIEADKKSLFNFRILAYARINESLPATFLANKNLIAEKEINATAFYCNRDYANDMLHEYYMNCLMKEKQKLHRDIIIKIKNDKYDSAIKLLSDSVYTVFHGFLKDIKMYKSFQELLLPEVVDKELNIDILKKCFVKNLGNEYIKTLVLNTTYEHRSEIVNLSSNNSDDILGRLLQKHKGKTLYIDISATWCGPCLQELPYSAVLHESLNNENVVFVYLFAKSNRVDWKKLIAKHDLQGENIFLSDEQYNLLLSKYNMSTGFPQYLLIDKNGEISKNAKRPSMKGAKEDILKLLN